MYNLADDFINNNIENESIFKKDVIDGVVVELKTLNSKFHDYLFKVFACSYINKTITYNSIKYKKQRKEEQTREELILNTIPEGFDEERINTIIDVSTSQNELFSETNNYSQVFNVIIENLELLKAINTLTERQKEVLYLHFVLDQKENKIAEKLNVSLQAINKTKNQAIRKLRRKMEVTD